MQLRADGDGQQVGDLHGDGGRDACAMHEAVGKDAHGVVEHHRGKPAVQDVCGVAHPGLRLIGKLQRFRFVIASDKAGDDHVLHGVRQHMGKVGDDIFRAFLHFCIALNSGHSVCFLLLAEIALRRMAGTVSVYHNQAKTDARIPLTALFFCTAAPKRARRGRTEGAPQAAEATGKILPAGRER